MQKQNSIPTNRRINLQTDKVHHEQSFEVFRCTEFNKYFFMLYVHELKITFKENYSLASVLGPKLGTNFLKQTRIFYNP